MTIRIIGARPEDALGRRLKKAFGDAAVFSSLASPPTKTVDLAIGIFKGSDHQALLAFAERAHVAGGVSLCVQLRESEVLIGPLALPNRAGCGRCAFERMTAAAAGSEPIPGNAGVSPAIDAGETPAFPGSLTSPEIAKVAGQFLVREVRAIIRRGPELSQVLDHVLAIDAQTLDASLHKVIPLARCSICGGAAAFPNVAQKPLRLSPEDSPEVVLGALAGWVDQRCGIISNLFLEPPSDVVAGLPMIATAIPPHIIKEDGSLRRLPLGWGKGLTVSGAVLSAVGEAIERYAASLPDLSRVIWERPNDLDCEFIDPRTCALYTDAQYERDGFPYPRFDPNARHPWILGKWLSTGAPVWVPAIFAFLSFTLRPEQLFSQGSSNGLAASTDPEEAALRATLELVERDAFMAAWLTGIHGRRVALDDTLDPSLRSVLSGVEGLGATVEVYILPTSVCGTTVLCLALGDGDQYPGATIGLGADLDSRSALRQAILELGQTGPYLRRMMRSEALPIPDGPSCVREMLQHATYYFPRERATVFNRLRSSEAPLALRDLVKGPKRSLLSCASELDAAGIRVALVDVTSADVATGPFRVMRAVSPDLQSLSYGDGLERSQVERIRRLGVASDIPAIHPIW
jgi:ribosomal protein S12 methylthiotransferase accessory factor